MVFFRINSKTIKQPSEITLSKEILDNFERTMDGTLVVDILGSKDKIEVSWDYLSENDMKILSSELNKNQFITVDYCSSVDEKIKTITAYSTNLQYMPFYDWVRKRVMWQNVSVSFMER